MERKTMDRAEYELIAARLDQLDDLAGELLESDATTRLRTVIQQLADSLGQRYSVHLGLEVTVADFDREAVLPLLTTGMTTNAGQESYRTHDDCSWHRYLVDGTPQMAPHDRCPACWQEWGFKHEQTTCPSCGLNLGKEVRILLDTDICPFCEQGRITASEPTCTRCGFEVDPRWVTWG